MRDVAQQGVAVLVCCHDPNHILWFCDRAAVMHEGAILSEGASAEALTAQVLRRVYGPRCLRVSVDGMEMVRPENAETRSSRKV